MSGESKKNLRQFECVPCRGGEPPLTEEEWTQYLPEIPEWQVVRVTDVPRLVRVYRFKNYRQALDFSQKIGEAAEQQDHHPRMIVEWGKVEVQWWTHKINGLHKNDFIMAARSDEAYQQFM